MYKNNTLQQYIKNIPKENFNKFQKDFAYLIGLANLRDYNKMKLGYYLEKEEKNEK